LAYQLPEFDVSLAYQAGDFTQINPAVNRQMVSRALSWLQPDDNDCVADCFAGVGNFTLPLARRAGRVLAYELVAGMVDKLRGNARDNGLMNITGKVANLFAEDFSLPAGVNKLLLDPPRAGAEQLCRQLANTELQRLVYISCNPQTLRRDVQVLLQGGFRLQQAALVDMFPHTAHSEAMLLLVKV
jgi:23S rRNA (uracil1939-C5)-methyltransferase